MTLIAYNLVKSNCQEAAHSVGKDLRLMSFKGALDTIVANTARYLRRQRHVKKIREIWASTIEMIAEKVIDLRAFRKETRAQKKRPISYHKGSVPVRYGVGSGDDLGGDPHPVALAGQSDGLVNEALEAVDFVE